MSPLIDDPGLRTRRDRHCRGSPARPPMGRRLSGRAPPRPPLPQLPAHTPRGGRAERVQAVSRAYRRGVGWGRALLLRPPIHQRGKLRPRNQGLEGSGRGAAPPPGLAEHLPPQKAAGGTSFITVLLAPRKGQSRPARGPQSGPRGSRRPHWAACARSPAARCGPRRLGRPKRNLVSLVQASLSSSDVRSRSFLGSRGPSTAPHAGLRPPESPGAAPRPTEGKAGAHGHRDDC